MKLAIFETPRGKEPVRLRLVPSIDGGVTVVAVDPYGNRESCGNLFTITAEGVMFHGSVNPALGFPLDDNGELIVVE